MSNKMIKGAAIIGIAGIIAKVLGAFFRIPLTNWIGDVGMSYYGFAYTIYVTLLVLSTAGFPVAISRLVSESIAKKEYKNAHKIFKTSIRMMFVIGLVSFLLCFFGGGALASALGNADAKLAIQAISPALLFVSMDAAFRGYFQGRQNMNPTAITEVVEQLIRVIVGLILAKQFLSISLQKSAAGAAFGASAGSFAALVVIFLIYLLNRKTIMYKIRAHSQIEEDTTKLIKKITLIAVPIIIGSEIMPIMNLIDMGIIMRRLQATGWTYEAAKAKYGLISGFCSSLIGFPQLFTQAVAISLVPAIARGAALEDGKEVEKNISLGYRLTMIMAFPCALGIFALAKPILFLFYPLQKEAATEAVSTLMIMAIGVIALALSQTSTGVLQAIGKQNLPVKHLLYGCGVKIILTFILVGIPAINIKGAAIGTMVASAIAYGFNERSIKQFTGAKIDINITYVKPCIASIVMAIVAFGVHRILLGLVGNSIATLIAIFIGAVVYGILIIVLKAITAEEVKSLPGGAKLSKIIRKFERA